MKSADHNRTAIAAPLWTERALLLIASITVAQWLVEFATTGQTNFTAATYVTISLVLFASFRAGRRQRQYRDKGAR